MRAVSAVMLFVALCGIRPWGAESSPIIKDCKMDAVFVIDNSDSITSSKKYMENWDMVLEFAQNIASKLDISPDKTHVALVDFHSFAKVHFGLKKFMNVYDVVREIGNLAYQGFSTNTPQALAYAREVLLSKRFGARPEVPKVIFMITDGEPAKRYEGGLDEAIYLTKQAGIRIIAVGVTNEVKVDTLRKLASSDTGYFVAKEFSDLDAIKDLILDDETCVRPTIPPTTTTSPPPTTVPSTTLPPTTSTTATTTTTTPSTTTESTTTESTTTPSTTTESTTTESTTTESTTTESTTTESTTTESTTTESTTTESTTTESTTTESTTTESTTTESTTTESTTTESTTTESTTTESTTTESTTTESTTTESTTTESTTAPFISTTTTTTPPPTESTTTLVTYPPPPTIPPTIPTPPATTEEPCEESEEDSSSSSSSEESSDADYDYDDSDDYDDGSYDDSDESYDDDDGDVPDCKEVIINF